MKAVVVIGNNYKFNKNDFENAFIIGVDKGALFCHKNNIMMDLAIGDFDSISNADFNCINAKKIIKLNPIKDQTDTKEAIDYCKEYDEIILLGAIQGKRIEHFYANLLLLNDYKNLKIKDDSSFIFTAEENIEIKNEYKYISIFSLEEESIISLSGMKYNLSNYILKKNDPLCISNEIIANLGKISIKKGRILIILSKEDNLWNPFIDI